jgi:hypothetical protein
MESETADPDEALDARLQALDTQLEEVQQRSATAQEHMHALHQEHEALLAQAMQIMRTSIPLGGGLGRARDLLADTRVLVREERDLLKEWHRLFQAKQALQREHHVLLARIARTSL